MDKLILILCAAVLIFSLGYLAGGMRVLGQCPGEIRHGGVVYRCEFKALED